MKHIIPINEYSTDVDNLGFNSPKSRTRKKEWPCIAWRNKPHSSGDQFSDSSEKTTFNFVNVAF